MMLSFLKKKLGEGIKKLTKDVEEEVVDETQIQEDNQENIKKEIKNTNSKKSDETKKEKGKITDLFTKKTLSENKFEDIFWEIEIALLESNIAIEVIEKIKEDLKIVLVNNKINRFKIEETIKDTLTKSLKEILTYEKEDLIKLIKEKKDKPYLLALIGINGGGKTTTIAKLTKLFQNNGIKPVIAACDTFRAAAIHQVEEHANNLKVKLIKHDYGADATAVAFDAREHAKSKNLDVVLIDTAGRLHNKVNLMNELSKVKRVMQKVVVDAPHDVMLVLDGSTGQNAFEQAKQFTKATEVTALALTKLDGTAKGGVVIGISDQFKIPVKYIGIGEKLEHLQIFRRREFVESLFS